MAWRSFIPAGWTSKRGHFCSYWPSVGSNFVNWSAVCYEKYAANLSDWMLYLKSGLVSDAAKVNVMVGERRLCPYWIDEIRQLIKGISHLHSIGIGLYHGALNKSLSYILVGGSFKLINVEGLLIEHDPSKQELKKTKDFHGLQIVLERIFTLLSKFGVFCFRHAGYVNSLKNHPFLKTHNGRMRPWNTKAAIASWKDYMKEIYRHMDSDYDGSLMVDLLRFHRNLYQHYIHVNCRKRGGVRVIIEEVVADARSDVLHMIPFPTVDQAYAYVRREDVRQAVMMGSSVPTSISLAAKSAPRSGPLTRAGHPHNSSTAAYLQIQSYVTAGGMPPPKTIPPFIPQSSDGWQWLYALWQPQTYTRYLF
ncbi:unnamed protein product [Prunus armeniaca]